MSATRITHGLTNLPFILNNTDKITLKWVNEKCISLQVKGKSSVGKSALVEQNIFRH